MAADTAAESKSDEEIMRQRVRENLKYLEVPQLETRLAVYFLRFKKKKKMKFGDICLKFDEI